VSGADRASYLQGLFTNDIAALGPGTGCYTAYLTPQGRMIADLFVYELGDSMLLTMEQQTKDPLLARLERFVFTEDVTIADLTGALVPIAVVGPQAADAVVEALPGVDGRRLENLPVSGAFRIEGTPGVVARVNDMGVEGFEVYLDPDRAAGFENALAAGRAIVLDATTADAIRIEAGIPRFHVDMDEDTIPLEAGIEDRAISFTKGCYVGQEVIVRVLHRGHGRVSKKLVGLTLDGMSVPARGAPVRAEGRDVGRVSSSALSPALNRPIALASVHRDFTEPGIRLEVDENGATVTSLPFVR
jgi:folate-binding protein YgfZ